MCETRPADLPSPASCLLGLAGLLYSALHLTFGDRPVYVHVRWAPGVDGAARQRLEQQYRLVLPELREGRTFGYALTDRSRDNVRSLVLDPSAEDTAQIHRTRFRVGYFAPRLPYVTSRPWMPAGLEVLIALCFLMGLVSIGLALLGIAAPARVRGPVLTLRDAFLDPLAAGQRTAEGFRRSVVPAITRGIPELRAEVLGFFRFFYAAFLFLALAGGRWQLAPGSVADASPNWRWVAWLAGRTDVMAALEYGLFALLALFAIGLCTRVAYWLIAAGMTTCVLVSIQSDESGVHVWIVAAFMILCLIPAPWHATPLSVDDAIRRWRGRASARGLRGKSYGYAVWMPGLILGTVWLSAAYSKMEGGLEWILGGAVKYHWVIDAAKGTPVEWGLWVASHHWVSVLMSFSGVFFEAVFVLSVFARPGRWRNVLALTGLPLLVGFHLFHNVLWWPWWLVYLSFAIPWTGLYDLLASRVRRWSRVSSTSATPPSPGLHHDLRPVHMVLIALVCVHAALGAARGLRPLRPILHTYASTAAFDAANAIDPVDRLWIGYGTASSTEVANAERAMNVILELANDEPLPPALADWIRAHEGIQRLISLQPLQGEFPTSR